MAFTVLTILQAIKATDDSPAVPEHTTVETPTNMSPENKAYFLAEKEAIHLILTGIGDEMYLTVDACQTAQEMWEAIERLQQGESLNIQDVKTNLFWEFSKFTSHDGELMESYYTRFYKLINEMIRNNLTVTTMQVNVQFLQQLQPEWSRFVMIVKQQHKLDEVSYHKLFDILKQYQNKVNELCAKKLARNANPLALVATAQASQDPYYQTPRTVNVVAARENVGSKVVQQSGIQCFNCKEYGHFAKECRKPKRVKDSAYHKEKMLLCKQAEQGFPLQAEQYDWLTNTDEEVDEQELEAHYSYMAKIQEVPIADSGTNLEPVEQVQNEAGYNVFANHLQHSEQSESVSNTCLVETDDGNVIPDSPNMCEDDIQNEQNDIESDDERVTLGNLIANLKLDTKQAEFEKFKAFNDRTIDYDKLEYLKAQLQDKNIAISELKKLIKKGKGKSVDTKFDRPSVVRKPNAQRILKPSVLGKLTPFSDSLKRKYFPKTMSVSKTNVSEGLSKPVTAQTLPQAAKKAIVQLILFIIDSGCMKHMTGNLKLLCNFVEKFLEIILFIIDSGCSKHMTGNLKLLINFVEKFLGTVKFGNDQIGPILGYGDLVQGAITIKRVYYVEGLNYNLFSIGSRGTDLYSITLQDTSSPNPICLMAKATLSQAWLCHRRLSHLNFDTINLLSKNDIV
nr:hypothetical protein [Tanacetum cinerariifolium]